jgi:hypothetical protein
VPSATWGWNGAVEFRAGELSMSDAYGRQPLKKTAGTLHGRPADNARVHTPLEVSGTLTRLAGLVLEAVGLKVPVGSQCLIDNGPERSRAGRGGGFLRVTAPT